MGSFYVVLGPDVSHPSIEVWSAKRLPFEPKGWELQFRSDVHEALQRLSFVPGSTLAALYMSPITEYCDVENIVFYNVGSASFSHLRCKSIRFERVCSEPPTLPNSAATGWKHYLSYDLINTERGLTHLEPARLLAKWEHVPCGVLTSSSKVSSIWHYFKLGIGAGRVQRFVRSEVLGTNLGLKVTIHVPKSTSRNLTSMIKPVFDGIVAAFSKHDGSIDLVAKRLAAALGVDQQELTYLLENETMAILGARNLVWPRGNGVQWNPNDDLLVAGELSLVDYISEQEWESSGELFEVREAKSGTHPL